jgi:glycosyltransferase involved in cell wall biosynthesis
MSSAPRGRLLVVNWQDLENPLAGGAEVHLQENLRRLSAMGFEITLLCSHFEGAKAVTEWEHVRILRRGGRYDFNWRVPGWVRSLVREERFDLVVEDINKIPFYTPLYQPLPVLALVPHMFATTVFHEINLLLASYIYLCEYPVRWAYRRVPFCVISESTRQDLIGRGLSPDLVRVIHCGIDASLYRRDPTVGKAQRPTILYLGRLKKYKSVQHLIAAFALLLRRVPEAQLIVVGEGDHRAALQAQVRRAGLESQVRFTGFIAAHEKVRLLRESWVAVCPSLKEGWGLTNIEANACGTAVVAADVPGLRDSVRHGKNGYLYPYGNLEALEGALHRVVTDSAERRTLEQGGLEWARAFDWDQAATELAQLIDLVIRSSSERK